MLFKKIIKKNKITFFVRTKKKILLNSSKLKKKPGRWINTCIHFELNKKSSNRPSDITLVMDGTLKIFKFITFKKKKTLSTYTEFL